MIFTFEVIGTPVPKGSSRAFVVGRQVVPGDRSMIAGAHAVTVADNSKNLKRWEQAIAQAAQVEARKVIIGALPTYDAPVGVELYFLLPRPATVKESKRRYPSIKPDVDKLARAALDAITGVLIKDDCQVIQLKAEKVYGPTGQPGRLKVVIFDLKELP